jgi:hypothetical protein
MGKVFYSEKAANELGDDHIEHIMADEAKEEMAGHGDDTPFKNGTADHGEREQGQLGRPDTAFKRTDGYAESGAQYGEPSCPA